jgi:hypothetical protein
MRGYPFLGQADNQLYGDVIVNGRIAGQVSITTAATPEYDRVLIIPKVFLDKYHWDLDTFRDRPLAAAVSNHVAFDGVRYVIHRIDLLSGSVVLVPAKKYALALREHTKENWPIGGDQPQVA